MKTTQSTPGVRFCHKTSQYFPTVNGVDISPTSFDKSRALQIAADACNTEPRATYCPEDDKLRLFVGRVPRAEYEDLRAEGWTSTPKQDCDFVAVWTPQREATAIRYAGIIEDEDMSPEERAADRAERFAGYRDRRTMEAVSHADRYDSGPAVHGYQDYGRAVKAADRHDRIAGRAVNSWDKAEYWQRRTAGVISHALHKCSPGVRMGRINTLEAELRRCMEAIEQAKSRWNNWQRIAAISDPDEQTAEAIRYTGGCPGIDYGFKHPRPETVSNPYYRENKTSLYSLLTCKEPITGAEACALYFGRYREPGDSSPMSRHLEMRLAYERQMLEAQGGRAGELEMEVGGFFCGKQIHKVNKSAKTGRVVSVQVMGTTSGYTKESGYKEYATRPCLVNVDVERSSPDSYRAPTPEEKEAFIAAQKAKKDAAPKKEKAPLINPTDEDAERLQALWNERGKADYSAMIARRYGTTDRWNEYAEKSWKPATLCRITQAQYSEVSKGAYARAETRGVCRSGRLEPQKYSHGEEKERAIVGPAVFEIRTAGTDGCDFYAPRRVIVLTDKPQKPLPAEVWESAPVVSEPELVTASNA